MNDPRLSDLLTLGQQIWADQPPMDLPHIAVAACTVTGDIARISRDHIENSEGRDAQAELSRELGNLILSSIRWAANLGLDPAECVSQAEDAQRRYVESRTEAARGDQ